MMAKYIIDANAAMKWIAANPQNERNTKSTIRQSYSNQDADGLANFDAKELIEEKNTFNDTMCGFRFDMIKLLIGTLLANDGDLVAMEDDELSFAQRTCLDSLIKIDIIKKIG